MLLAVSAGRAALCSSKLLVSGQRLVTLCYCCCCLVHGSLVIGLTPVRCLRLLCPGGRRSRCSSGGSCGGGGGLGCCPASFCSGEPALLVAMVERRRVSWCGSVSLLALPPCCCCRSTTTIGSRRGGGGGSLVGAIERQWTRCRRPASKTTWLCQHRPVGSRRHRGSDDCWVVRCSIGSARSGVMR